MGYARPTTGTPISDPPEHRVLLGKLQRSRDAVIAATDGLHEAALRAPGVASGTDLVGLVHHLTGVEHHWIQTVFLGDGSITDKRMHAPADRSASEIVAANLEAATRTDATAGRHGLSDPAAAPNAGERQRDSLRVITHLIEETARHAGHADILCERIDAGRSAGDIDSPGSVSDQRDRDQGTRTGMSR